MTPVEKIPGLIASKKEAIKELSDDIDFLKEELERYFCNALVGDKFTQGAHTLTRATNAQQWDYTEQQKREQNELKKRHQKRTKKESAGPPMRPNIGTTPPPDPLPL